MHAVPPADREPEANADSTPKAIKPSKLDRMKSAAATAGIYVIPGAVIGGFMVLSYKMSKMDLETAKLNLETAKLQDLADLANQK